MEVKKKVKVAVNQIKCTFTLSKITDLFSLKIVGNITDNASTKLNLNLMQNCYAIIKVIITLHLININFTEG